MVSKQQREKEELAMLADFGRQQKSAEKVLMNQFRESNMIKNMFTQITNDKNAGKLSAVEAAKWMTRINKGETYESPKGEPKKRGRPAKPKPSELIEVDRNVAANTRIRNDDAYDNAIMSLRSQDKITTKQLTSMLGMLEDNKYAQLDKALATHGVTVHQTSMIQEPEPEPEPAPVHVPKKKRGRPKKDTTREEIQKLMHEISSTKHHKSIDLGPEPKLKNRILTKHYATPKAMSKSMSSHNVATVKKCLKAKAGQLLDSVEHSSLLKYINQF